MRNLLQQAGRGSALVVCLMVLAILTLLGTAALLTTSTETKITHNARKSEEAFYAAEAGIDHILCLPDPLSLAKNEVVESEALGKPGTYGPQYAVTVLDVIVQHDVGIVNVESVGYDQKKLARRMLRSDIQIALTEEGEVVKEKGMSVRIY